MQSLFPVINKKDFCKKIFSDIRFYLILFFIVRMYGITHPPLEAAHHWRQSLVAMVSRNFLEENNNIFYPRVDIAGEKSGITGMEFPLLNYLIYIMSLLFGYTHWYGRLINLIVSSFGLFFYYKLIKNYYNKDIAFNATLILCVSVWFQFSRKIMPDTFSMSLVMVSVYFATNYFDHNKNRFLNLIFCFVLLTAGILSKISSAYLLVIFSFFILSKSYTYTHKIVFILTISVSILIAYVWYFYWVPYLMNYYGYRCFFMGKDFHTGLMEIISGFRSTLRMFYDVPLKYIGFAAFLSGLYFSFRENAKRIYITWAVCFLAFSVFIIKSGNLFFIHTYYIIPFVPVMAWVAGYGIERMKQKKIALILLSGIVIEGISNQQHDFRIPEYNKNLLNIESHLDLISGRKDKILINSGDCPTPMYFAHRKGWISFNNNILNKNYIHDLKLNGLKYIVILKKTFGSDIKLLDYKKVFENNLYTIYKISE